MTANKAALALRLLLVAVALYLIFLFTNLPTVLQRLAGVEAAPITVAFLIFLIRQPFAVLRWKILLDYMGVRTPFWELFRLSMSSLFFGLMLPANGGDIARGILMRRSGGPWSTIAASILLDRFYGVISLLFLAFPGGLLLMSRGAHGGAAIVLVLGSTAILAGVIFLLLLYRFPGAEPGAAKDGIRYQALVMLRLLLDGLRHPRSSGLCLLLSLVAQILAIASAWCVGMGIGFAIPFDVYLAFVPVVWLVTALPVTVLGIGLREASFAALFATAGIPVAQSVSIGLLNSAIAIAASLLGGLIYLLPRRDAPSD